MKPSPFSSFEVKFLFATYALLSSLPFYPLVQGRVVSHPFAILLVELGIWVGAWALLKRLRWVHLVLLPVFIAVPVELYLQSNFSQSISAHHLGIMFETSPNEAKEFLGSAVWGLLAAELFCIAWWWQGMRIVWRHDNLTWTGSTRWAALSIVVTVALVIIYGQEVGFHKKNGSASVSYSASASTSYEKWRRNAPRLPEWLDNPIDYDLLMLTWPWGLPLKINDFLAERKYLAQLAHKNDDFEFQAKRRTSAPQSMTLVLVIGESSRFDRWSLNGYERETNPLLAQEKNLVSLQNIITPVSATRLSVPIIITRKSAMQSLKAGFSEKSMLTAFKEAGFKTFWFSNQMSFGQFDTPVSVFAREADVVKFFNLGSYTEGKIFDEVLLPPLENALHDQAPFKLIVLHSLGNHWNYSHRYPAKFDHWKPSLKGIHSPTYTDLRLKPALNNSYDNSILYTDWWLSQVIATLKKQSQLNGLVYVSDHGQTLYDGSCNLAFHGHNTRHEFHIPAFVWYSDEFQQRYPNQVSQLKRMRHAPLSTENVFHSVLDMAQIEYPKEQIQFSWFNPQWQTKTRYVDSYGWTNYDNADFKGDCKEVIDRDEPLKQEK